MNNPHVSLKDRLVIRLITSPDSLDMRQFSARRVKKKRTPCGTTFCLAGMILDESDVALTYGESGYATGLGPNVVPPSQRWVEHEISLSEVHVEPAKVVIAAKAREIWASQFGDESAKLLPFYGADWGIENCDLNRISAQELIEFLQIVNLVAVNDGHVSKVA